MGGLTGRASRLLAGGIPLPGVFHDVLSHMLENGRSATGDSITKVVRVHLQDLHEARALAYWGSWERLADDLLEEMESRELVTRDGEGWVLTERIFEGARVRPGPGIRVTVYSGIIRQRREAMAFARQRASAYRSFLEEQGLYSGRIQRAFEALWNALDWEGNWQEQGKRQQVRRGVISGFTRQYLESHPGQWVSAKEAETAFRELHPEYRSGAGTSSSFWNPMNQMHLKGLAERREEGTPGREGRKHSMFRWKQEQ